MPTCPTCGANLSPDWKFCVSCGSTVPTAGPWRSAGTGGGSGTGGIGGTGIPGAIRPEQPVAPARRRLGPVVLARAILGIVLAVVSIVLAVVGTVLAVALMFGMLAR